MRTCYAARWRIFADSSKTILGRYYRSPAGTPFVRSPTVFTSADWTNTPYEDPPKYGEVWGTRTYDKGYTPAELPAPRYAGTPKCAGGPFNLADTIPYCDSFDGWPLACFNFPPEMEPWFRWSTTRRGSVQLFWSWIICELYDDNQFRITSVLTAVFGPDVGIAYYPRVGKLPRFVVVWTDAWCMVAMEGTTGFQQGAEELWYSPLGPIDFGQFGSHPLWLEGSIYIVSALHDIGYVRGTPIFFAGHSLGGACVLTTAVRLKLWTPGCAVRYLTYGCPAIGDLRAYNFLRQCDGTCVINTGDIVPSVPFGLAELGPVLPIVAGVLVARLNRWVNAPFPWTQNELGGVTQGNSQQFTSAAILQQYTDIQNGVQAAPLDAHRLTMYILRITLRVTGPAWPVCEQLLYNTLTDCTGPAFGWWLLGGPVPTPTPMGGAIVLGGPAPIPDGSSCELAYPLEFGVWYDLSSDLHSGLTRTALARLNAAVSLTVYRAATGVVAVAWYEGPDCATVVPGVEVAPPFNTQQTAIFAAAETGIWMTIQEFLLTGARYRVDLWPAESSGSWELGGAAPVPPTIPGGALELGGDAPVFPVPGLTCLSAPSLSVGVSYHLHVVLAPFTLYWLVWPVSSGASLEIKITGSSADGPWSGTFRDGTCSSSTFLASVSGDADLFWTSTGPLITFGFTGLGATYVTFDIEIM